MLFDCCSFSVNGLCPTTTFLYMVQIVNVLNSNSQLCACRVAAKFHVALRWLSLYDRMIAFHVKIMFLSWKN